MKRTFLFFAFAVLGVSLLLVTGCASAKNSGMRTNAEETEIVDWSHRNLDSPAKPDWLKKLVLGNTDVFKEEFGIENSYVIKYGIAAGRTRDLALAASRVNYNAMRAEELRTKVVSEAAATLNDDGMTDATANAAMVARVDVSGHELVTQFWQEVVTRDEEAGLEEREFICYSVYKITREGWLETLSNYMKSVLPALPDAESKKKMAETIASLYEDTTTPVVKSEAEAIAEINTKLDAIQSGSQSASYPAPNPADAEWLDVLDTACNIIF